MVLVGCSYIYRELASILLQSKVPCLWMTAYVYDMRLLLFLHMAMSGFFGSLLIQVALHSYIYYCLMAFDHYLY